MIARRLAAAALAALAVTLIPAPARATWVPLNYSFCDSQYTQDQLQYVSEPVLSVYSVTFQQGGFFEYTPSTAWATDRSKWTLNQNGFATVPVQFTAEGDYLIFFQYTPFVWDVRYASIDTPKTVSGIFIPDGVYQDVVLRIGNANGNPVKDDTVVSFPGWSFDIDPFEALTSSGIIKLACVAKTRQVFVRPYVLPNLLNVFIQSSEGSFCGPVTWGIDAQPPIVLDIKIKPGGCSELPTSRNRSVAPRPPRLPPGT